VIFADARLGDTVDVSQLLEERARAVALSRVRQELRARPGVTECTSCGDAISPARLAALPAAQRCTDCQSLLESRKRK
jgi:phage/conjugal plasmid C-4 type zinc finger TraR family protein